MRIGEELGLHGLNGFSGFFGTRIARIKWHPHILMIQIGWGILIFRIFDGGCYE